MLDGTPNIKCAVVLDTDIGDDIDDALALALLLNSPEVEGRGITTVFRDAPRRAQFTRALLEAYGRADVPVAAGVSQPLLQSWESIGGGAQVGQQFEVLPADEKVPDFPHALDFMVETLRDYDETEELPVLLCIGPLTNAALLLARLPELAPRLKIVLMGAMFGQEFHGQPWEWNIYCDPEAAAMVLRSGAHISIVPINVTRQCVLAPEQCATLENATSEGGRLLGRLVQLWRQETNGQPILHDPLAALTLFSDVVTWENKCVEVELCGNRRGVTRYGEGAANCRVAVAVDAPRAIGELLRRVIP